MERKFYVCDLDGTLDLSDKSLSSRIMELNRNKVDFVVATGRTNNYVKETCKTNNIVEPRYVIADNGGTIFDNQSNKYLKKTTIKPEFRRRILEEFLAHGGRLEDVRYTDGESVYAAENSDVREYYKSERIIKYATAESLMNAILSGNGDITKMTLSGSKGIIKHIMQFIKESHISCWTDIGETKFPIFSRRNYRLDIMDNVSSKGIALHELLCMAGVKKFVCIGNGLNDMSMFELALKHRMPIVVVKNMYKGKMTEESRMLIDMILEYAYGIGIENDETEKLLTVMDFPANGYLSRIQEESISKQRRINFAIGLSVRGVEGYNGEKMKSEEESTRGRELEPLGK